METVRKWNQGLYEDVVQFTRSEKAQIRKLGQKYGAVKLSRYGSYYIYASAANNPRNTFTVRVSDHPTGFSAEYYGHCNFEFDASDYEREGFETLISELIYVLENGDLPD